jgi:hypothetical protein
MQIQKFGIEIRKLGNLSNLYKDVDMVLSNYKVPSGEVTKSAQAATVAHALQKMLKTDRYFDVCTIKDCVEVCKIYIPYERMSIYRAVHCVHWNEMLPDYRQLIIAMVLDDFRSVLNPEQ